VGVKWQSIMRKILLIIFTLLALYSCTANSGSNHVSSVSKDERIQKIDNDLQKMQAELPLDWGNEWIHIAASRVENTIIFEYEASKLYQGGYDHELMKRQLIDQIRGIPEVYSSQMNFKVIYKFPDGKVDTLYVKLEEYKMK
jgi:hypothetical protein